MSAMNKHKCRAYYRLDRGICIFHARLELTTDDKLSLVAGAHLPGINHFIISPNDVRAFTRVHVRFGSNHPEARSRGAR